VIRLSKSSLSAAEKKAVMDVLDREHLGMGIEVRRFEEALSSYFNRRVACVVNGTTALQLALQAVGIGTGDEVLVPSLTYVASFQAISAIGAIPVACDVDPATLTLDVGDALARITPRTRAVMPVHYSGGVGDLVGIYAMARSHGLRVIEDAAHAFGSVHDGERVGSTGDIACFSFDGIKNITSGEGGCVVSDNREAIERIADARLLGVCRDTEKRYAGSRSWEFDVVEQGWRGHMSNIMAAIGLAQLERFPELSARRKYLARCYDAALKNDDRFGLIAHDYSAVTPHIYVVRIRGRRDRDAIRRRLFDRKIETGVHYYPNHRLSYFKRAGAELFLPITDTIFHELLTLPLHPDLTENDIDTVTSELSQALDD
jgi:dTDP-4-amino-4,6-dideoxygalactose transaminase